MDKHVQCSLFVDEVRKTINVLSLEKPSNTPDYILAEYLWECLESFHQTVYQRDKWYKREHDNTSIDR